MALVTPHMLIVDDTFLDHLVASRVLKNFYFSVTIVVSPMQALEFLDAEHDVNLILTNYCMPDMTGYDLLMEVKESPRLNHILVVIMSSDDISERKKKCLDARAKDYIIKPLSVVDVPHILSYI
ncbi:hypothetical protein BS78_04G109800, partial [Paspalum vaginatum]